MSRIDRFLQPLFKSGAERLIVAAGEQVTLRAGTASRPLTAEAAPGPLVEGMLQEILPADLKEAVAEGARCDFPYASPFGPVLVSITGTREALRLEVEPAEQASAGLAPYPSADSPAAPAPIASPVAAASSPSASTAAMDGLFRTMVRERCSDLHLSTGNPPLFRKDGDIVPLNDTTELTGARARELLYSITPQRYRDVFETAHDVDFSYEIEGLARFRCNLFLDRLGMGGVFRVIPSKIPTAEELGLSRQILELCHLPKGLVVVTGPTGSGKSTTLAAMIDYINRNMNAHLITIEDPIEFVHRNRRCLINQREIGTHTHGFKQALRAALREDPDIVLVGEMRDLETVAIAIETAETGHLVFGTLHTNTAPSTVDRMIDQFPSDRQAQIRTMLSESLKGVISQTLCRRKGGGRVAAQEVLIMSAAISNLIREGKTFQIPSLMQTGRSLGMVCMNDALADLVQKGLVDPNEACSRAIAKAELRSLLARAGHKVEVSSAG